jgi:hypothetical protein
LDLRSIGKEFQLIIEVITMTMFPIGTGEADDLGQQQRITARVQAPCRCLKPWYFYVKSSNYILINVVGFLFNIDVCKTSYPVMELVLDNGQWNYLSSNGASAR